MFESLPKQVFVREVGPRDGLQIEKEFVPTEIKAEFIRRLADAGLKHIEITSFVHPKWIPALADAMEIGARFADMPGVYTSALVPNMKGLEGALKTGMKEVTVFMSATESHNKSNINRSTAESLEMFSELIPTMKKEGLTVGAAVSVACGCPYEGNVDPNRVAEIAGEMVGFGADHIMLGDTIGVGTPTQIKLLLEKVGKDIDIAKIGLHLHDTQATALANVIAGLEMGVTCFDSAVAGLGGCPYAPGASGNLPTENLIYMLEGMGIDTGVDLGKLLEVGLWIQEVIGRDLPSNGLRAYRGRKAAAEAAAS